MNTKAKKGAAQSDTSLRGLINRYAFFVAIGIVVGLAGWVIYWNAAAKSDATLAITKAIDIARNQVEPKFAEFERTKQRMPRGNFELEIPGRSADTWKPLMVVDLLPDGSLYFSFLNTDSAQTGAAFVWRLRDSKTGKANTCGALNVPLAALKANGLECDSKVPEIEPTTMNAMMAAANVTAHPELAAAQGRTRLNVNRTKGPADFVIEAIGRDNDKTLEKLKAQGINICQADSQGRLPVTEAARSNQIKALTFLAVAKCNLQEVEPYSGQTALTSAVILRNVDASITVLAAGADPNFANKTGAAPLLLLGTSPDSLTMHLREALRRRGASLDIKDASGITLLMMAADRGSLSLASWLIANGAKPDIQDNDGRTALMHAVLSTNGDDVAKALIGAKAAVNIRDANGLTALGMVRGLQDPTRQTILEGMLNPAGAQP